MQRFLVSESFVGREVQRGGGNGEVIAYFIMRRGRVRLLRRGKIVKVIISKRRGLSLMRRLVFSIFHLEKLRFYNSNIIAILYLIS